MMAEENSKLPFVTPVSLNDSSSRLKRLSLSIDSAELQKWSSLSLFFLPVSYSSCNLRRRVAIPVRKPKLPNQVQSPLQTQSVFIRFCPTEPPMMNERIDKAVPPPLLLFPLSCWQQDQRAFIGNHGHSWRPSRASTKEFSSILSII